MEILDHPDAQVLLDDATLSASAVHACSDQLESFIARYLPRFLARNNASMPAPSCRAS